MKKYMDYETEKVIIDMLNVIKGNDKDYQETMNFKSWECGIILNDATKTKEIKEQVLNLMDFVQNYIGSDTEEWVLYVGGEYEPEIGWEEKEA